MFKISREVDLALLLLTDLAKKEEQVGLKEWSEERGLPYRYLSKIAVRLKKKRILKSKEGREGGYTLGKSAGKIQVSEVIEIFDGPIAPVECMKGKKCSCADICGHKSLMEKLARAIKKQLARVTIKDLC